MTIPDPTYITVAELKENSKITALVSLSDGDITTLIQHAEDQIDGFCGPQRHHPYDDNVVRVFPREQDYERTNLTEYPYEPEIPYEVSRACQLQVEFLYLQWWANSSTQQATIQNTVESISIGGDGSISETYAKGGVDLSAATLSPLVQSMLKAFRSRSGVIGYANPCGSASLSRASSVSPLSTRE